MSVVAFLLCILVITVTAIYLYRKLNPQGVLMLAGLGVIVIWPCVWGVMLYLVYAIFGNLVFIIIQRYNRPRLVRLYERKRAKRSKEA